MAGLLRSLTYRLRLAAWRRSQMTNVALRRHFAEAYDVHVGLYSYGCFDRWRMPGPITIGRYCSFGNSVRAIDSNHPIHGITTHPLIYEPRFGVVERDAIQAKRLIIEDDVWVGHNAVILPGCRFVGRGAIIGAGSIVTRDVPRYSVVAGNPAHFIRWRFPEVITARLEASLWWELSMIELARAEQLYPGLVTRPTVEGLDTYLTATKPERT